MNAATIKPAADHQHTMAYAEIALSQVKALRQPATPRNYEVWYTYATGYNTSLNQAINGALAQKDALTDTDLEQLYADHISPTRLAGTINAVGPRAAEEIIRVMTMAAASAAAAGACTENLGNIISKLGSTNDRKDLRTVIKMLAQTVIEMKKDSEALEAQIVTSKGQINRLQQTLEVARNESLTDPLTGIADRKHFAERLAKAMAESRECGEPLSFVMTDVDHFKSFNEAWGHPTGDHVLRLIAGQIKQNIKVRDVAARFGGDEFAVILPNTRVQTARRAADQIRHAIMSKDIRKRSTGQKLGRVTVSIGVSMALKDDTSESLIARAVTHLNAAKHHGRNRVVCESDPEAVAGGRRTQVCLSPARVSVHASPLPN
jgi:diguanylate cyclase